MTTIRIKNQHHLDQTVEGILKEFPAAVAYGSDGFEVVLDYIAMSDLYNDVTGILIWDNEERSKNDDGAKAKYRLMGG